MSLSLDPAINPILRIYRLFRRHRPSAKDSRHFLGFGQAPLRALGGTVARQLVGFLRASALSFDTCRLCLKGHPIVDFAEGSAESWFDWEIIADLAREGILDGESARILGSWRRRLDTYLDSGVWTGGNPEDDCLRILEQTADLDREGRAFTLDVSLAKRDLVEDFLLTVLPVPADEISAFLWYDLEAMGGAYADFPEFLRDAGAERPIVVFVFQPLPAYSGDFFKVLPLNGPSASISERERAVADALGAFTPRVLSRYRDLRRRHSAEPRPRGRLDLPPALFLHGCGGELSDYPVNPLFEAGPWRSWLACAVLSWLARATETDGGVTIFVLPGGHRIALELRLEDVSWAGKSLFEAAGWSRQAALLAWHVEHATGSDQLRGLWARALAETQVEDFAPPALWKTLESVCQRFCGMLSLRDVTSESFILLQADWPAAQSRDLVARLEASHVILSAEPRETFFLFTRSQVLDSLGEETDPEMPTHRALGLEATEPPAALESDVKAAAAPELCIVTEGGRLLGFRASVLPEAGPAETRYRLREATSGGPDSAAVVSRTLQAGLPDQISLDEPVALSVSLSLDPAGLPMALPPGATVDILVQPRHGLDLRGPGEGQLEISEAGTPRPLDFELRATAQGRAEVAVMAFHQGQRLGALTLKPEAVSAPARQSQPIRDSRRLHPATVEQPDLTLTILEHHSDGRPAFTLRLSARDPSHGLNLKKFGPVELHLDPLRYFDDFFSGIENRSCRTTEERDRTRDYLAARGDYLFEKLIPRDLQTTLWTMRDQIHSVRVQSEEPWIPWELLRLQGRDQNGRIVEGKFLCEAFAMTRWLVGLGLRPKLGLRRIALVVPADSRLSYAARERDFLLSLAGEDRQVEEIAANALDVRRALASGEYDSWHFSGHGAARPDPNSSVMLLEGKDELTPEDLSGVVKNLGEARPLVFLNACQIGRSAMSLTGIGGWAQRFLEAGAAAFIGAYWSVYDQAAFDFAVTLYRRLLRGDPIGRAAREARQEISRWGDPTWLAYTVYADPSAVVWP